MRAVDILFAGASCALVVAAAGLPYLHSLDGKFAYDDKVRGRNMAARALLRAAAARRWL